MVCGPGASVEMVNHVCSTLPTSIMVTGFWGVPSMVKVTVPVGVPPDWGATVAVMVTAWPAVDGFADEATVVVVPSWLTCWVIVALVLVWKSVLVT